MTPETKARLIALLLNDVNRMLNKIVDTCEHEGVSDLDDIRSIGEALGFDPDVFDDFEE